MEWDTSHLPLKEDVLLSHLKAVLDVPMLLHVSATLGQCSRNHHVGISLATGFGYPRKLEQG